MNVRNLEISLRPRNGWEAVDLGFMLTRAYYLDLLKIGFCGLFPFFVVVSILCWKVGWLSALLIWLLKPIYDRFYLHYFSRKIFGEKTSVKEVLAQAPRLIFKRSFPLLTILRLGPARSMMLAVRDLEQLKGRDYRKRVSVLGRIGSGSAMMTTFTLHLCEYALLFGSLIFLALLIPQGQFQSLDEFSQFFIVNETVANFTYLLSALLYGVIVLVLEPFYVGAGFSLYLNSRCSQEAWDIELRFKEFASRVNKTSLQKASLIVLSCFFVFFSSPSLSAEERDPQEVIESVYAQKDFEIKKTKTRKWVPDEKEGDADLTWLENLLEWLSKFEGKGKSNASFSPLLVIMKVLGYVVLVAMIASVLYVLIRVIVNARRPDLSVAPKRLKKHVPSTIMGMDITRESLPEDLLSVARQAWDQGQFKQALSLLYRGALSDVVTKYEAEIEGSDTEYECLKAAQKVLPQTQGDYFTTLSTQWIATAYSKKRTNDHTFLTLCNQWPF